MEIPQWMLVGMASDALALPSPTALSSLVDRAKEYAADARASSTQHAYAADFAAFETWCAVQGLASMPATPADRERHGGYPAAHRDGAIAKGACRR